MNRSHLPSKAPLARRALPRSFSIPRFLLCLLCALCGDLFFPSTASAHDVPLLTVTTRFRFDDRYRTEVTVDPEHLPAWLGNEPPHSPEAARNLAEFLRDQIITNGELYFDGVPVRLDPEGAEVSAPGVSGKITVTFEGPIPPGARAASWSCTLDSGKYLLRFSNAGDAETTNQWLQAGKTSDPFPLNTPSAHATTAHIVSQYLALGFTHILPRGLDHILFVLGLFLLSMKARPLLLQVTAFTIAHSITLALSMYGVVRLPSTVVEPLIALSIAYVAIENIFVSNLKPWRTLVVFGFGLLHGMGFAGVLQELGLPRSQFVTALVSFNVGVELGQLSVIAIAFVAVGAWCARRPWYRSRVIIPASAAIALVGLFWTVQRLGA